jgi:hypothetical protein
MRPLFLSLLALPVSAAAAPVPLSLLMDDLRPGATAEIAVYGATPGETVRLYRSDGGFGVGPCPAMFAGDCIGILPGSGYQLTLSGVADVDGRVSWTVPVPVLPDTPLWWQAVQVVGGGLSIPLYRPVQTPRDDPWEPNDAILDAAPLSPPVDQAFWYRDLDHYEVMVPPGHTLVAYLDDVDPVDFDLSLFDPLASFVGERLTGTDSEGYAWTNDGTLPFPITIRVARGVYADDRPAPYRMVVRTEEVGSTCVDDAAEPDDGVAIARELRAGETVTGVLCPNDADMFVFPARAGDGIAVRTAFGPSFDEATETFTAAGEPFGNDLQAQEVATADGLHSVRLFRSRPDDRLHLPSTGLEYTITADFGGPVACIDDGDEGDDTQAAARRLDPDGVGRGTACASDDDWFEFHVDADQEVWMVDDFEGPGNVRMSLHDASGAMVADNADISYVTTQAGSLWLRVRNNDPHPRGRGTDYNVAIQTAPWIPCFDGPHRVHDDLGNALPLAFGTPHVGVACVDETDWFELNTSLGDYVRVDVDPLLGSGERIAVFDDAGNRVVLTFTGVASVPVTWSGPTYLEIRGSTARGADRSTVYAVTATVGTPEVCVEDAAEPNDDVASATLVTPEVPFGIVACAGNPDWVRVAGTRGGALSLTSVRTDLGRGDVDVAVYDGAGNVLGTGGLSLDLADLPYTGDYFVAFTLVDDGPEAGGEAHEVTIHAFDASPCVADAYEPNDLAQPTPWSLGTQIAATSCLDDDDHYVVDLVAGERLRLLALLDETNRDQALELTIDGPTGPLVTDSIREPGFEATAVASGPHVVRVRTVDDDLAGGGIPYVLDAAVIAPCEVDAFEPDSTETAATLFTSGTYSGVVCEGDPDYFRLDLTAGDRVFLDAATTPRFEPIADWTRQGFSLDVVGQTGVYTSVYAGSTTSLVWEAPSTGSFVFWLEADDDPVEGGVPWTLDLDIQPAAPCVADALEPNDDAATASATGGSAVACADDDWFAIPALAGDRIRADLAYDALYETLDVVLLDPAGRALVVPEAGARPDVVVDVMAPSDGVYHLVVRQVVDDPVSPGVDYTLDLSGTSAPLCVDDAFEPDDTPFDARPLVGSTDATACVGDVDWLSLAVVEGEQVVVTLDTLAELPLTMTLYDAAGTWLGSDATWPYALPHTAAADGVVYLSVEAAGQPWQGQAYTLAATVVGTCDIDAFEDDDRRADAVAVSPGVLTGTVCDVLDEDWVEVSLRVGDTLTATLSFAHADGDLDLELYRNGTRVAASLSTADAETITYDVTSRGTYTLRTLLYADADGDAPGNAYELDVDVR